VLAAAKNLDYHAKSPLFGARGDSSLPLVAQNDTYQDLVERVLVTGLLREQCHAAGVTRLLLPRARATGILPLKPPFVNTAELC